MTNIPYHPTFAYCAAFTSPLDPRPLPPAVRMSQKIPILSPKRLIREICRLVAEIKYLGRELISRIRSQQSTTASKPACLLTCVPATKLALQDAIPACQGRAYRVHWCLGGLVRNEVRAQAGRSMAREELWVWGLCIAWGAWDGKLHPHTTSQMSCFLDPELARGPLPLTPLSSCQLHRSPDLLGFEASPYLD